MTISDYPQVINGRTVWACCLSAIGPVCEHQAPPEAGGPCSPGGCEWVAGMMVVSEEDLDEVAAHREVTCQDCERVYDPSQRFTDGYLRSETAWVYEPPLIEIEGDDGWTGVSGLPWAGTG